MFFSLFKGHNPVKSIRKLFKTQKSNTVLPIEKPVETNLKEENLKSSFYGDLTNRKHRSGSTADSEASYRSNMEIQEKHMFGNMMSGGEETIYLKTELFPWE